jgi:hypothetical protein
MLGYGARIAKGRNMKRAFVLAVVLTVIGAGAYAQRLSTAEPLQFQEVVAVNGATRDQIYNAALEWFSGTFNDARSELIPNRLAATLTSTGFEKYVPLFMSSSCSGWIRYRVLLAARDGRYYYTIDRFSHEGDALCSKRSFGLLTTDWLGMSVSKTIVDLTLQPQRREDDEMRSWLDMKTKATTLAGTLARSLRARLKRAANDKPAG